MAKLSYSMNDIYPFSSMSATTSGLTIEDDDLPTQNSSTEIEGKKTFISKNLVLGALLFFVVMSLLIGMVD